MSSLVQVRSEHLPTDALSSIPTVDMAIKGAEPKFTNADGRVGCLFKDSSFLYKLDDSVTSYNYTSTFTVCFWCKFTNLGRTDEAYPNSITLILEDGTVLQATIPTTIDMTQWHWVKLERDASDEITFTIDSTVILTQTETAPLNLSSDSHIFVGNTNKYFTGYEVVCDDILIFGSSLGSLATAPTDYLDPADFIMLLYIKVSDGTVWGYKNI